MSDSHDLASRLHQSTENKIKADRSDTYEGGIVLRDVRNNASASVDLRSKAGLTWLTVAAMSDRGGGSLTVDLSPDQVAELEGALRLAREAAREFEIRAMGVK